MPFAAVLCDIGAAEEGALGGAGTATLWPLCTRYGAGAAAGSAPGSELLLFEAVKNVENVDNINARKWDQPLKFAKRNDRINNRKYC